MSKANIQTNQYLIKNVNYNICPPHTHLNTHINISPNGWQPNQIINHEMLYDMCVTEITRLINWIGPNCWQRKKKICYTNYNEFCDDRQSRNEGIKRALLTFSVNTGNK